MDRVLCSLLIASAPAFCQTTQQPLHTVQASAEATVMVKPDKAEVTIGVTSEGKDAQATAAQNATQTKTLIDALKGALGAGGQVKTSGYSLTPQFQRVKNSPPKITGYRLSNNVLVTIYDLSLVGKVIDTAINTGGNDVGQVSFSIRNEQPARLEALAEASRKAQANAEAIAKALGLHVSGVIEAQTGGPQMVRPFPVLAQTVEVSGTTIEAHDVPISASVTVTCAVQY